MRNTLTLSLLALLVAATVHAQAPGMAAAGMESTEIRLWPGGAPGTEHWTQEETLTLSASGERILMNVSDPTLSVFLPDPAIATGTAIVIAPGGGLRLLSIDNEGVRFAEWLNERGIAAFVLKYRTLQQVPSQRSGPPAGMPGPSAGPQQELDIVHANANPAPDDERLSEVLEMGIADVQAALTLVHQHAEAWQIDPARVGIAGFSAGGGLAIGATLAGNSEAYPAFLITAYGPALMDVHVPDHAPPLFIAVGNAHFNVTKGSLALFESWRQAGKPAEIHIYDQVSAGFGMTRRGLPVDDWTERLHEWLLARELTRGND